MELDAETTRQVGVSLAAVAVLVVGIVGASVAFGTTQVERQVMEPLSGEVDIPGANGSDTASFDGRLRGQTGGQVNGTITGGTLDGGNLTGQFTGDISGDVSGEVSGEVSGTVENGTFDGQFTGTVAGTSQRVSVGSAGGVAVVGLLGFFVVLMGGVGLWLARQDV